LLAHRREAFSRDPAQSEKNKETFMPRSTNPPTVANARNNSQRPSASQLSSAALRDFRRLTVEEKNTYRRWRRGTLAAYGILVFVITAFLIANGPTGSSTNAGNKNFHTTLSYIEQRTHP
jgi:hypothetical protein